MQFLQRTCTLSSLIFTVMWCVEAWSVSRRFLSAILPSQCSICLRIFWSSISSQVSCLSFSLLVSMTLLWLTSWQEPMWVISVCVTVKISKDHKYQRIPSWQGARLQESIHAAQKDADFLWLDSRTLEHKWFLYICYIIGKAYYSPKTHVLEDWFLVEKYLCGGTFKRQT